MDDNLDKIPKPPGYVAPVKKEINWQPKQNFNQQFQQGLRQQNPGQLGMPSFQQPGQLGMPSFQQPLQLGMSSFQQPAYQPVKQTVVQETEQSISQHVDEEQVAILMSLEFSKNVAEKALLFTGNKGFEEALKWIEEHSNDADFEQELKIIASPEQNLSVQEAAQKARELQKQIREKRQKQEEQDELERERNRLKSGKAMTDARREIEEVKNKKKFEMELQKKQRIQDEIDKQRMLEQLQKDKELRFGKKADGGAVSQPVQEQKQQTPLEKFVLGLKQIKTAQSPELVPEVAFNTLSLIQKILDNIIKNPNEQKFRKIKLDSKVYKEKIDQVFGARNALDSIGFIEEDGFYLFNGNDIALLGQSLQATLQELKGL